MTTTVTVKHQGPDHHDVLVESFDPVTNSDTQELGRLKIGEEVQAHIYGRRALVVREVEKKQ